MPFFPDPFIHISLAKPKRPLEEKFWWCQDAPKIFQQKKCHIFTTAFEENYSSYTVSTPGSGI
jgi:hypothetical protein